MLDEETLTDEAVIQFIRAKLASEVEQASKTPDEIPFYGVEFWPPILCEHIESARTLLLKQGDFRVTYSAPQTEMIPHGMNTGSIFGPQYDYLRYESVPASFSIEPTTPL